MPHGGAYTRGMRETEYSKCSKGHTVYPATDTADEWCECKRTESVGTQTYRLYNRKTRSWCGLPAGQRKARS